MSHQSNIPKQPGLYWYRMNGGADWHFCEVIRHTFTRKLCVYADGGLRPVKELHRHWKRQLTRPR